MNLERLTYKLGIGVLTATLLNPSLTFANGLYAKLGISTQNINNSEIGIESYEEEKRFESKDGRYSIPLDVSKSASYILQDNELERRVTRDLISRNTNKGKWTYVAHLYSMINPKTGLIEESNTGIDDFRKLYRNTVIAISIFWRPKEYDLETEFSSGISTFQKNSRWIEGSEEKIKIGEQEGKKGRFSVDDRGKYVYSEYIVIHVNDRAYEIFLRVNEDPKEHQELLNKIKNIRFTKIKR